MISKAQDPDIEKFRRQRKKRIQLLEYIDEKKNEFFKTEKKLAV